MFRYILLCCGIMLPLLIWAAGQHQQEDPDIQVKGNAQLPEGWQLRLDKPDARPQDLSFSKAGERFEVKTGPAAIFYHPDYQAQHPYTVAATFRQMQPSRHPEAYGLFIGGQDLQSADQKYSYFLVRQDGKYLVKLREGEQTSAVVNWTAHDAVRKIGDEGPAINALRLEVSKDSVQFFINGQKVESLAASGVKYTVGQSGFRINHNLNVEVENFRLDKMQSE